MTATTASTYSIQQRLLKSLLIGLPILWLFMTSISAWRLWHEINEINDTQITQLASYLIGLSQDDDFTHENALTQPKIFNLEHGVLSGNLGAAEADYMGFALWDTQGHLIMADENGKHFTFLPQQHGFLETPTLYQELNPFSHSWRLFYVHDKTYQHVIAVGQNLESRQEIIYKSLAVQLVPAMIGLIFFISFVWVAIRQGFLPLNQISQNLALRDPHDERALTVDVPKEVQPLVTALNQLFAKVADTLAREQRFTADASHELRSPLTALRLQTDVMQQQILQANLDDVTTDTLFYHTAQIHQGAERANHLVEQLLILAKLAPEQGLDTKQLSSIDWLTLSDTLLSEVNRQAREKHIQLRRELLADTDKLLPLHGNPTLISLLLRNLLDNAIRYTPDGSIITLQLSENFVQVIDNGKGVNPTDLTRLTERFFRPAGQHEHGSGLGLSIVKRIADLHQLKVAMQNRIQDGNVTGFMVTLTPITTTPNKNAR